MKKYALLLIQKCQIIILYIADSGNNGVRISPPPTIIIVYSEVKKFLEAIIG